MTATKPINYLQAVLGIIDTMSQVHVVMDHFGRDRSDGPAGPCVRTISC